MLQTPTIAEKCNKIVHKFIKDTIESKSTLKIWMYSLSYIIIAAFEIVAEKIISLADVKGKKEKLDSTFKTNLTFLTRVHQF